ncbi:MAG: hypothetical protein ACTS5I_13135 [Rhodanobacter sp.]
MAIEKINPATAVGASERKRVPMSVPVQRLEAPEISGFHLHWFNGTPERLQRAIDGGYEFVDEREMKINSVSLGGDTTRSGNTDMGSRVSVVSGQEVGKDGQPMRLILMKIRQEWYEQDQLLVDAKNDRVAMALKGGLVGSEKDAMGDTQQRYVDKARTKIPDLFTKKSPRRAA